MSATKAPNNAELLQPRAVDGACMVGGGNWAVRGVAVSVTAVGPLAPVGETWAGVAPGDEPDAGFATREPGGGEVVGGTTRTGTGTGLGTVDCEALTGDKGGDAVAGGGVAAGGDVVALGCGTGVGT